MNDLSKKFDILYVYSKKRKNLCGIKLSGLKVRSYNRQVEWNLRNKETTGPRKGVLISEVSLIRRLHYSIANNSGLRTLVLISEVSAIGGVRFRRFHCI